MHRKGFAKIYSTNFVDGPGTFVEPGAVHGRERVNGGPVGKLTATTQQPSQSFVEGTFDALTSYKVVFAAFHTHTHTHPPPSI